MYEQFKPTLAPFYFPGCLYHPLLLWTNRPSQKPTSLCNSYFIHLNCVFMAILSQLSPLIFIAYSKITSKQFFFRPWACYYAHNEKKLKSTLLTAVKSPQRVFKAYLASHYKQPPHTSVQSTSFINSTWCIFHTVNNTFICLSKHNARDWTTLLPVCPQTGPRGKACRVGPRPLFSLPGQLIGFAVRRDGEVAFMLLCVVVIAVVIFVQDCVVCVGIYMYCGIMI